MPILKRNKSSSDIHSASDIKVTRALNLDKVRQTNQLLVVALGIFMLSTIVFAFRTYAASTGNHNKPYGVVDVPIGNSGTLLFSGWAVDSQFAREGGIAGIQIYIDKVDAGHYFGKADYKYPRPEVCSTFKDGRVGCPKIGWYKQIDTVKHRITDGKHTFIAKIIDKDKSPHYFLAKRVFKVNNYGLPEVDPINPPDDIVIPNDPPAVVIESLGQPTNSMNVNVAGYAVDSDARPESGVLKVQIYVDGVFKGDAVYGEESYKACAFYVYRPDCPLAGFSYTFDGTGLSYTDHTIKAVAIDTTGKTSEALGTFNYVNHISLGPRSEIDRPDEVLGGNLVHFIYMLPYDADDRQYDIDSTLKNSINSQQQWFKGQTGGRTIRYDTYGGGEPDVTFFRVTNPAYTKAYYKTLGYNILYTAKSQMQLAGFNDKTKKYIIILEGGSESACGLGELSGNAAIVELDGSYPGSSFTCSLVRFTTDVNNPQYLDFTSTHELVHMLGQTPYCAKNNYAPNPYHVSDIDNTNGANDLMYGITYNYTKRILDINNDDYYFIGGAAGCTPNTLNVSPYIN